MGDITTYSGRSENSSLTSVPPAFSSGDGCHRTTTTPRRSIGDGTSALVARARRSAGSSRIVDEDFGDAIGLLQRPSAMSSLKQSVERGASPWCPASEEKLETSLASRSLVTAT